MASLGCRPAARSNWTCFSSRGSETIRSGELRRASSAAAARSAGRTQGGQVLGRLLFQQRLQHALRIDLNARGKLGHRARPADLVPRRRRHGGGDQVDERFEVGLVAAALSAQGDGRGRVESVSARVRSSPISAAERNEASRAPAWAWATAISASQASRCCGSSACWARATAGANSPAAIWARIKASLGSAAAAANVQATAQKPMAATSSHVGAHEMA